jgi:hypothetical protein
MTLFLLDVSKARYRVGNGLLRGTGSGGTKKDEPSQRGPFIETRTATTEMLMSGK